ncbi:unnamed protein product [Dicrocoelium dendriticum]|nr:unnamed protein product [Dicrocoelium dendriticum]
MTVAYSSVLGTEWDIIDAYYSDGNLYSEPSVMPTNTMMPTTETLTTDTETLSSSSRNESTTNTVPATTLAVMASHTDGDVTDENQTNVSYGEFCPFGFKVNVRL